MDTSNKLCFSSIIGLLGLLLLYSVPNLQAQENPEKILSTTVEAEIDVSETGSKIDTLLYGHFIENLSNWFEGGLWAEMLGDRKFFYPVNNKEKLDPPNSRDWILGQWRPYGPESAVIMDSDKSYVGEHSPRVNVLHNARRGIQQSGLPLESGKQYEGRVILAATTSVADTPGPSVQVSLVWGEGSNERQSLTIDTLSSDYEKYHFSISSGANTKNGRIEITGTGTGSFLVGAVSLMPANNIKGFRPDLLELLREMNVTMLRWGGNFSAGYEWRDGIGDRDKRPPKYDYAWDAVEQNDMGTFEFLALNRLIGSEPNIGVNAGFGDAYSAGQWVEYVNGSKDTPMGKLRARHGHPKPFDVTWWGIGNEMYGEWQLGHMSLEHYTIKHNMLAKRMRAADSDIILVASGASPYEMSMTSRHWTPPLPAELPFQFGTPQDWSGGLLENSAPYFDYLAEHFYPEPEQIFDVEKQGLVEVNDPLVDRNRRGANRVQTTVEAWEIYNQRFPWLRSSDKKIVLDEWVSGSRGLEGALGTATVLNKIFRHTDIFKMSAYTCAPCALTYTGTESAMEGIGLVFKLYSTHFARIPIQVRGDKPQKEVRGTVGVDKPKETSGSDTYPLDVMASVSEDRKTLTITAVNPTHSEQNLDLSISGGTITGEGSHWIITGPGIEAQNQAGESLPVTLEKSGSIQSTAAISVAPISINLYKFSLE